MIVAFNGTVGSMLLPEVDLTYSDSKSMTVLITSLRGKGETHMVFNGTREEVTSMVSQLADAVGLKVAT